MITIANNIKNKLILTGMKCFDDTSTVIDKKYVRCDENNVLFVITVDLGSVINGMVTIRKRDTMHQQLVHIDNIHKILTTRSDLEK